MRLLQSYDIPVIKIFIVPDMFVCGTVSERIKIPSVL